LFLILLILVPLAVFDQVGNQWMQPIDRDELFGKIEGRSKVIDSAFAPRSNSLPTIPGPLANTEYH
jgi:hypothetical protein